MQFLLFLLLSCYARALSANGEMIPSEEDPGLFHKAKLFHAIYKLHWNGCTMGRGELYMDQLPERQLELFLQGQTIGLFRAFYSLDITLRTIVDACTIRPLETEQVKIVRGKKTTAHLAFSAKGVACSTKEEQRGGDVTSLKRIVAPYPCDPHTALLYLRHQPLEIGDSYRLTVYSSTRCYLATITVLGREMISLPIGSYGAIKLALQLHKWSKELTLKPDHKLRYATIWLSDDDDRIPLRMEAQLFVGSFFAELQAIRFEQG